MEDDAVWVRIAVNTHYLPVPGGRLYRYRYGGTASIVFVAGISDAS